MSSIRGQTALDFLLSLLVLLIVLAAFSPVLVFFENTQKEISLRQQLRENVTLISLLSVYSATALNTSVTYPATNSVSGGQFLADRTNAYARSTGIVLLEKVRLPGSFVSPTCLFNYDVNGTAFAHRILVPASDTRLPADVDVNVHSLIRSGYDSNHSFNLSGCLDYFSLESLP